MFKSVKFILQLFSTTQIIYSKLLFQKDVEIFSGTESTIHFLTVSIISNLHRSVYSLYYIIYSTEIIVNHTCSVNDLLYLCILALFSRIENI